MGVFAAVYNTANHVGSSYPLVDQQDIRQELWLWVLNHEDKVSDWSTEEGGEGKLYVSLRHAGTKFARKEQEARSHVTGTAGEGNGTPLWVEITEDLD